jgi:outer membrane beta-barrel protein
MKTPSTGLHFPLRALVLTMAASSAVVAVPARAADDDAPAAGDTDAAADSDTDTDATDADGDAAATDGDADAPAGVEKPVLEETIFVVQGKPFLAQGRFELTPQFAQSVNDSFTSHTGLMVSGLYHLKENVAVEATVGAFMWVDERSGSPRLGGRDTDLTVELRQKENLAPERVKLYQFPYLLAGNLQWSPMYGKVNIQDFVLGQFNLYLSVGAGIAGLQLETLTPGVANQNFVELTSAIAPTTSFGGGLRFYFSDWLGVRVEVRDYVMPLAVFQSGANAIADADAPSFDVTNLILAQLGVSFVF